MLDLCSSYQTVFVQTRSWRWIFSSAVTCTAVVLFETIILIVQQPLSVIADVVFPWFVHADIIFETVALNTLIMWQFLSQMLQLNVHQWSVLFQNRTSLPFSDFSHGLSLNRITNALTWALQIVIRKPFSVANFQCRQHKIYSSIS
jgi:hypothetical protein